MNFLHKIQHWPRAFGEPDSSARYRRQASDFRVTEITGFDLDGEGDHLCLFIRKTGLNTQDVIDALVQQFAVQPVDIGYFGLKDKQAITEQWFSIHLPGKAGDFHTLVDIGFHHPSIEILKVKQHMRKFRIGSHRANKFGLLLSEFTGYAPDTEDRLNRLSSIGFPNYFGEQRFGFGAANLAKAQSLFQQTTNGRRRGSISRRQRSLYLSAARSFLFNEVLAHRIEQGNWLIPQLDERLMLQGSRSHFDNSVTDDAEQAALIQRIAELDIHTTGPLWGTTSATNAMLTWEADLLAAFTDYRIGLEQAGMKLERRALRAVPLNLQYRWVDATSLELTFELPAGTYATSLLRELIRTA